MCFICPPDAITTALCEQPDWLTWILKGSGRRFAALEPAVSPPGIQVIAHPKMLNEDASGVLASDFVACIVSVTALIFFRGQMYVSLTVTRTSSLDGEAMTASGGRGRGGGTDQEAACVQSSHAEFSMLDLQ